MEYMKILNSFKEQIKNSMRILGKDNATVELN